MILLSLAIGSTTCWRVAVEDDPLRGTAPPVTACSRLPPPPLEQPVDLAGPDAGCPPAFARCLDAPNAVKLAGNVERLREYAEQAWAACGTPPDAGP